MTGSSAPEIFDRRRRRALRERAGRRGGQSSFLWTHIAEDIAERLAMVSRDFERVAIIGPLAAYSREILADRPATPALISLSDAERRTDDGPIVEEDKLPFEPESYDLIICAGTLDSINDPPGALLRLRFALKPDGLFLGHMFSAGTLASLKSAMLAADGARAVPHIHPQIELQSAADLLSRSGFAMPVADSDALTIRYSGWRALVADIRDCGIGNALSGVRPYLGSDYAKRLDGAWQSLAEPDGKVSEQFIHIHMSGWAPSPEQPQPARRGSGVSLARILPARGQDDNK